MNKIMNKKGFSIGDMLPLGITMVVLGIALAMGLTILTDFQTEQGATTTAGNATGKAIEGLTTFTDYLPTIALVVVVAVVIGIVVTYLVRRM